MPIKVKYFGPVLEPSGYGHASRQYIIALLTAGVDVSIEPINFGNLGTIKTDAEYQTITPFIHKPIKPDVNIIHCTPENWHRYVKDNIPNIGVTIWETTKLHPIWVNQINRLPIKDLWVPNEFNKAVFNNHTDVPITIIPHVVNTSLFDTISTPLQTSFSLSPRTYIYYSIFQWTTRKNPDGLLAAYLSEFSPDDDVCLILKTHKFNLSLEERREISEEISDVRQSLGDIDFPPLYLILDVLSCEQIVQLHNTGDCYISPHRGEGWGLPLSEAMAAANPVVSTDWSGNTEFCNHENSYPISYQMAPVRGMPWSPWYSANQSWAEPSLDHLKKIMRHCYNNREEASQKGAVAKQQIAQYSPEKIGILMKNRLTELLS